MFKNEELKYIDLNYFHIIKIMQDENFIEIQSMSTKDGVFPAPSALHSFFSE